MREIRFTAFGKPLPQGSKNAFKTGNRVVLVEASKGLKPWRSVVALAAKEFHAWAGASWLMSVT